jgi:hypothetical protein
MEKEKKEISVKTAVKGLINGFVSYGILIMFIFLSLVIVVSWGVNNNKEVINYNVLKFSLPALASILIFFLLRAICRLSTYDLFKKCKIENEKIENVSSKMNFFYLCCILFFVCIIILYLTVKFNNEKALIQNYSNLYYEDYSSDFAEYKTDEMMEQCENNEMDTLIQTIIIEIGLIFGIFSLIPTQKKLIEQYNK